MSPRQLKMCLIITAMIFFGSVAAASAQDETPKDTPFFSGMPGYRIGVVEDSEFDAYNFFNGQECVTVEGRKYFREYWVNEGVRKASDLQIARNYTNAIKGMGGVIIFEGTAENECAQYSGAPLLIGKVLKGDNELWVEVVLGNEGISYALNLLVKEAMKQGVTAGSLFEALNRDGHVALYINFDFGKATIRPDSQPVIDQVAEMLQTNPTLKLGVEGHTDNVGSATSNKTLSENRAKAVVAALAAKGIEVGRLTAVGWGQDRPVADNSTEEGRAKNRRVELVKR